MKTMIMKGMMMPMIKSTKRTTVYQAIEPSALHNQDHHHVCAQHVCR